MSALYHMRYAGGTGLGEGVMYIGKGIILGADPLTGRYTGTYEVENGRFRGQATLSVSKPVQLVTGAQLHPGQTLQIQADWPENFADGRSLTISVQTFSVEVAFEKIGDIP